MGTLKTIVYAGGFWSTNIGNAFFDLGCLHLLKTVCPDARVIFGTEQPGNYWSFKGGNPKNSLDYLGSIKADYIVVAGTMFSKRFSFLWKNTLKKMMDNRCKLILLSVGCARYDDEEIQCVRNLLKEFPPYAIISRDKYTYEHFSDLSSISYDGIDCVFFIPDYFQPYELTMNKYVVFNFDKIPEPEFSEKERLKNKFEFIGKEWSYKSSAWNRFLEAIFFRKFQKKFGDFEIIRTRHNAYPGSVKKIFKAQNSFVSDIPYDYLNLYANSKGVFSDRVHACAAALALEKPAMLFRNTPRAEIFKRINLKSINKMPVTINKEYINLEKAKLTNFVQKILNE